MKRKKLKIDVPAKVIIDTSVFINATSQNHPYHQNALDYIGFFQTQGCTIYLSSIVQGEFCLRGDLDNLKGLLGDYLEIPYTNEDAEVCSALLRSKPEIIRNIDKKSARALVKEDFKIISQAKTRRIDAILTADRRLAHVYTQGTLIRGIYIANSLSTFLNELASEIQGPNLFSDLN